MYLYLIYWIVFSLAPDEVIIGEVFNVFNCDLCMFTTSRMAKVYTRDQLLALRPGTTSLSQTDRLLIDAIVQPSRLRATVSTQVWSHRGCRAGKRRLRAQTTQSDVTDGIPVIGAHRGCRAGRRVQQRRQLAASQALPAYWPGSSTPQAITKPIPVITGRRPQVRYSRSPRSTAVIDVQRFSAVPNRDVDAVVSTTPTLYVLNAAAACRSTLVRRPGRLRGTCCRHYRNSS